MWQKVEKFKEAERTEQSIGSGLVSSLTYVVAEAVIRLLDVITLGASSLDK